MTSKVLYFDKLPSQWTDATLREKLAPYGSVKRVVLLRKRNALYAGYNPTTLEPIRSNCVQALVEATDIATAAVILKLLENNPLKLTEEEDTGSPIVVSYSKNQELRDRNAGGTRGRHQSSGDENRILLVSVQNPTYPITTDLIYGIFRTYGCVEKVVIFMKSIGLQCLVQFAAVEEAVAAKNGLNALSIFPDCCTLVIHFSNLPQELIVNENGLRTKDFTNPDLPSPAQDNAVNSTNIPNTGFLPQYPPAVGMETGTPIIPGLGREVLSPVLLVCNLRDTVTCDQLFNVFSCYGNVARVKKLAGKPDHALIQFATQVSAQSAVVHLRGFTLLGRSLEISYSKHSYIAIRPSTTNSSTEFQGGAMKEYGNGVNRFTGKYANVTKHIYSPTKILHISNLDETTSEKELKDHLALYPNGDHVRISMFTNANGHLQALADFPSVDAATNVLASAHNELLGTRRLKIAFSKKPVRADTK